METVVASRGFSVTQGADGVTLTVPETRGTLRNRMLWIFVFTGGPGTLLIWALANGVVGAIFGFFFLGLPFLWWLLLTAVAPGPLAITLGPDSLSVRGKRYLKNDIRSVYAQGPGEVMVTGRSQFEMNAKAQQARANLALRWALVLAYGGQRFTLSQHLTEAMAIDVANEIATWLESRQAAAS